MKKTDNSYLLLTTAIFALLLLPTLGQKGMFLDGVIYSSIARNLSEGFGSFWSSFF